MGGGGRCIYCTFSVYVWEVSLLGPRGLVVNNVVVDRVHLEDVQSQSRVPRPAWDTGFFLPSTSVDRWGSGAGRGVSRTRGLCRPS